MTWANVILLSLTVCVLTPVAVLCVECAAAMFPRWRRRRAALGRRPRLAVLIPAHNEQAMLAIPLQSLMPQMRDGDRVIVVADNCTDATASIGRCHGAIAIEREDATHRGKGYALDFGMRHLSSDPPDILIVVDADCYVHDGAIDALAAQVMRTGRPAQGVYLLERPSQARAQDLVSTLAFLVKNWVRPIGLSRLGCACLLNGSGMAFPWRIIHRAKLDSGNIVEDMQLGLDLAMQGHAPRFCGEAHITGCFPERAAAALVQRTRWEHGHLQTLATQVPRLLGTGISRLRLDLLPLALELSVPPLSLLVLGLLGMSAIAIAATLLGASPLPMKMLMGALAGLGFCLFASWGKFARTQLPLTSLLAAPLYVFWKLPLYRRFFSRRQTEWVRTDRQEIRPWVGEELSIAGAAIRSLKASSDAMPRRDAAESYAVHRTLAGEASGVLEAAEEGLQNPRQNNLPGQPSDDRGSKFGDGVLALGGTGFYASPEDFRDPPAQSGLLGAIAADAVRGGQSIFLLGEDSAFCVAIAARLKQLHPSLQIVGVRGCAAALTASSPSEVPYARGRRAVSLTDELSTLLAAARPEIVLLGFESPLQEWLTSRLRRKLRRALPTTSWITTGPAFGCDSWQAVQSA